MKTVSIIVCTYNRCESLKDTLVALCELEPISGIDLEILVVDNNSSDKTRQIVSDRANTKIEQKIRYVFEPNQGLSHARNRGIQEAKGDWIFFTDDDVKPEKAWARELWLTITKYNPDGLGGKIIPNWAQSPPEWLKDRSVWGALACLDHGSEVIIPTRLNRNLFYGANMGFRKSVFFELGMFKTDLGVMGKNSAKGEDTEMLQRLFRAGRRVMYTPDAIVHHWVPAERMKLSYIRKQIYEAGKGVFVSSREGKGPMPRWFVRECFENGFKAVFSYVCFKKRNAIKREVSFWFQLGQIMQGLTLSRSAS